MLAIPALLIALVFAVSMRPSVTTVVFALSVVVWARFARITRGEVLAVVSQTYVTVAKSLGASSVRIMVQDIFLMSLIRLLSF